MLLKYTQAQKRIKAAGIGKPQRTAGGMVKLTSGLMTVVPKIHRRVIKAANKRPVTIHRNQAAVKREQIPVDPCENSSDSGLGFDHHLDYHTSLASHSALRFSDKEVAWQTEESPESKRRRLEIKLESDDANDNFTFPESVRQQAPRTICIPVRGRGRVVVPVTPLTLTSQLSASSHNGLTQMLIVCQPEQQHRARYQTEGSRGAVKDRTGNGFPVVKLVGYDRPATLQVFIGTDQGRVAPHMFYQACRVSGKNSTPCVEKKIDGTIVIEVDVEPSKDMVVTCDCVGILKERNVDVEHRFPEEGSGRSKKKSTRCRMVFRTTITNPDGSQETLQVTSQPIVCTQPPGVPEICKKSLSSCSVRGGQELFILGKNFLKDTRVVFQEGDTNNPSWSQSVQPDKEFLQQSHLVCVVPAYRTADISEPLSVRLVVESSGKSSEPHTFHFLPDSSVLAPDGNITNNSVIAQVEFLKGRGGYRGPLLDRRIHINGGSSGVFPSHLPVATPLLIPSEAAPPFLATQTSPGAEDKVRPVMMWEKPVDVIMLPPPTAVLPVTVRRSSVQMIVPDVLAPEDLKREVPESIMDPPKQIANVSDLSSTQPPSMDTFHRFVTNNSLPSINVGNYLSKLESSSIYTNKVIKSQIMNEMPRIVIPTSANKPIFSGDSSNLLTTVEPILVNQTAPLVFDSRTRSVNTSVSQPTQEGLSVIVNSSMIQKTSTDPQLDQDVQQHKQISDSQSMGGLDILMGPSLKKRGSSSTDRLDAFVNSAAESHISPTPTSVISDSSVLNSISEIVNETNDISHLQERNISPLMQTSSLPISPHMSPHHAATNLNDGNRSLCCLQASPQQAPSNQVQAVSSIQATLEHHLSSQNINRSQENIMMQSTTEVPENQTQTFSNLQASLEQLSSQSVISSPLSHTDINNLMRSTPQPASNPVQVLSNLQASLEQQLSPRAAQLNHSELNNLMQSSSQPSANQGQDLSNLQHSLERELSQTLTSSQMNHSNLSNLMQTSPQDSRNEAQALSNLQVTLEHLSSATVNPTQTIHSESGQQSNVSGMGNVMQTSPPTSVNEVPTLSTLQASLEHHLSSQRINSVQGTHESLTDGGISLNSLNSSITTSSQMQAAVSQAQALSNFQASFEHHLTSHVMNSNQAVIDSNTRCPNSLNSSMDNSQTSVNQGQALSELQMSLGQMTSQVLTPPQASHDSINTGTLQSSPQVQAVVSEAQVFSNLQASLEHHLTSHVTRTLQSSESLIPLERLNNPIQTSSQQSPHDTLSSIQVSIEHLSSQVLSSGHTNLNQSLTSDNLSIESSQTLNLTSPISLISSQPISVVSKTSSVSSPVMMSPNSHQSPASVLNSPGMSLSNSPTMALSPSIHNSQSIEMDPSNIVLTPSSLPPAELSMNNSSTLILTPSDIQMQTSQSVNLQPNSMTRFEQVASNMSQRIPVDVSAIDQYRQPEIQSTNKESENSRKEAPAYMISSRSAIVQQETNFDMKTQAPAQTEKKCEEGMPLPHELTQMSEHDLIRYINPSCFDTV